MSLEPVTPTPELRAGDYELLWPLATGGMGQVFLARKRSAGAFEKRVALKLLLPHLSTQPAFVQMFLDEARIAAQMNHPNVVSIFDLGVAEGRYFLAMALVEGVSLRTLLDACKQAGAPLSLPLVRLIASGLCEGLHYAHSLVGAGGTELKIIHRDVNPSNVLISVDGSVQLTDFGIAKATGSTHHTATGEVRGKVAYLAPEQVTEEFPVDQRADIYAAGVTLYQTLTLVSPFLRTTDAASLHAVQTAQAEDPTALRAEVGPRMAAALLRAMSRRPGERPESARALLADLVDGPIAHPAELGELVTRLCSTELRRFHEPEDAGVPHTQTHSLAAQTVTTLNTPRPRSGWRVGALVALVLGAGAAGTVLFFVQTARTPVTPEKVEPPPTHAELPPAPNPTPAMEALQPPAAPPPTPRKTVGEGPRNRKTRSVPSPVAPLKLGYLTADATPWAELLLDGKVIENTPISQYPVTAGEHLLVFRQPSTRREIRRQITVRQGEVTMVSVRFEK